MATEYGAVVICQCGRSASYPVCDGSHGRPADEPKQEHKSDSDPSKSGSWKR